MRIFWCQGGEADADIHRRSSEAVSSHHFPRLDQRSTRSNIEDDDDDKDVSWATDSTPDGLDRRDTRFRAESDHQDHPQRGRAGRQAVGKGGRADEALRYQVHVRSPSRERLAVIRLSRWFFADTPPPCIGQYRGADASALYGREADGRERKKAATHHTPRHEGKQGRAGQSSTRKTLKKSCKCRRGCDLVWWLGTGSPCGGDPVGGEDVRLRSVVKPGRKSGLDCGHFW
jgi:hypothetical protein